MTIAPRIACVCCAIALALVPHPALSQSVPPDLQSLKTLSLEELGALEVTSVSKAPEAVWTTPAAIFVLTRTDIVRSGATTVPDALRLVPGVDVARIDTSRNWVVGIRGFGDQFSKSVLVLVDGRSVYTPLWAGVHWPILDTMLEDIERIEVIRGPGGTIWGPNAQNGVINIITKSSRDTHGVYASGLVANIGDAVGEFRYGAGQNDLHYRVYGKATLRQPQFHSDGREFDTWAMGQVGFRADRQRGADQLVVSADAYKAELGESVLVSTFAPPGIFLGDDPVALYGFNARARWQRALSSGSSWSMQAYIDHTYRLGTDFGERRTTFDVDAVHQWAASPRHQVTWGAGARTSPSRVIHTFSFSRFTPEAHTLNLLTAFAQDAFTLVPRRVVITGGLKVGHNTYTGVDFQPSARVLFRPATDHSLWGGVTRAVRTPSRVDEDISVSILAQADPLIYGVISGNRDLEPESVVGLEAGYRGLVAGAFYLDVAAFRNRYDELVDLGPPQVGEQVTDGTAYTAVVFPWINGNAGTTKGFELSPEWQPSDRLRVRGTYAFLTIDLAAKPGNTDPKTLATLEGGTPRHQMTLQALMSLPGNVQIDPAYRYVSRRTATAVPSYHAVDLRASFPLPRGFELAIVGQNLLDAHHPEWARDPGPTVEIRRSVYASLTLRR